MEKTKVNEVLDKFSKVGCEMLDLIDDMVKEVTDNGKKEVVFDQYTPFTCDYVSLRCVNGETYAVTTLNTETHINDLTMNDWFEVIMILNDEQMYKLV